MAYDSTVASDVPKPFLLMIVEVVSSLVVTVAPLVDTDPENTNPVEVDLIV